MMAITIFASLNTQPLSANDKPDLDLRPALGKPPTTEFNSVINRDGEGLPAGSGSVLQGKALYELRCAACHGMDGRQKGNELAGGIGSLDSDRPLKTVGSYWPYATTLYDYIARAMPYNQEKSLSPQEVYAVVAYVLYLNGIVESNTVLDAETLPAIQMPNQNGFVEISTH